ncbi:MAG: copper chaperone PCu(A)C [Halothiobacillaceae bacterium]
MRKHHFTSALVALGLVLANPLQAAPAVSGAWVPEMPPGAHAYGAFMVLENPDDEVVSLVRAEAPGFSKIELHESVNVDGMHRMIEMSEIEIPPAGQTLLQPGGYHVMLIGPQTPLAAGDVVPITLHFSDGSVMQVDAEVRRRDQMKRGHMGGHAGH